MMAKPDLPTDDEIDRNDGKNPKDNGGGAGEDEGSALQEGKDDHLHEDQKPITK